MILIGCAGLTLLGLFSATLLGVFFWHVAQDPEGLWISAEVPAEVKLGDTVKLVVSVANRSADLDLELGDLDIADSYLRGFTIVSVSPDPKSTEINSYNEVTTTRFAVTLAPGATADFEFELLAQRVGRFRGQVDQYVGVQFLSAIVHTQVTR